MNKDTERQTYGWMDEWMENGALWKSEICMDSQYLDETLSERQVSDMNF